MFLLRSQWTPVSHFQEPPGAERDEEPVPVTQEFCKLKPLFNTNPSNVALYRPTLRPVIQAPNTLLVALAVDGDGCCL